MQYACIHTYIQTYIHTCTHTNTHTHYTPTHTYIHDQLIIAVRHTISKIKLNYLETWEEVSLELVKTVEIVFFNPDNPFNPPLQKERVQGFSPPFPGKHGDKEYACNPDLPGHLVNGDRRRERGSLLDPEARNRIVIVFDTHTRSLNSKPPSPSFSRP